MDTVLWLNANFEVHIIFFFFLTSIFVVFVRDQIPDLHSLKTSSLCSDFTSVPDRDLSRSALVKELKNMTNSEIDEKSCIHTYRISVYINILYMQSVRKIMISTNQFISKLNTVATIIYIYIIMYTHTYIYNM